MKKLKSLVLVSLIVLLFSPSAFADEKAEEGWEFMLTPYLWAAGLNTTLGVGEVTVPVDWTVGDVFDKLKFAVPVTFNVKKDRWGAFAGYLYMNVGEDDVAVETPGPLPISIAADYRYKINMFELAGAYRIAGTREHGLEAFVGLRYSRNKMELDIRGGGPLQVQQGGDFEESWTDLMLGFRYNAVFSSKWVMAVRGDIGFLSSSITINAMANLGYRLSRTFDIFLGYRYLDINYENDKEGREYFKFAGHLNGFNLGINIRFGQRL